MESLKKLKDVLFDSTLGLLSRYQKNAFSLAKIHTALFYLKSVQAFRKQILFALATLFTLLFLAVALVVAPFVVLTLAPLTAKAKFLLACALTVLDVAVPAAVLSSSLSEKKWIQLTKSDDLMGTALK